jgi:hypothetical protein
MPPDSGRGYDADMSGPPSELIFSIEKALEGGFVARALGHSIFTEADDLNSLRDAVRDAVRCHFDDPRSAEGRKSSRHETAASHPAAVRRQ